MDKQDIKLGMKVIDRTLNVTYTWIKSYGSVCDMCSYPDKFYLWEDEPIINTFGDIYRGKYCVDCAGVQDLEPIVHAI